jgi:alkylation response protein AidB-like acyl-CoA dehydrogenase
MSFESDLESVAATAAAHAAEVDRGTFPTASVKALADAGLLGLVSATSVGGKGQGLAEAARVVERLARECGSSAMVVMMHYAATAVIEQHGAEAVRRAIARAPG